MTRIARYLCGALMLTAAVATWEIPSSTAKGATIITNGVIGEDFTGGYDSHLFTVTNSDPSAIFVVSQGKLVFDGGPYTSGSTDERGGRLTPTFYVRGDFEATVDISGFSTSQVVGGELVLASLHIWSSSGNFFGRIGHGKSSTADRISFTVASFWGGLIGHVDNPDPSGELKLVREGKTLEGFWNGSSLGTAPLFSDEAVRIGLLAERWGTVDYFDVAFDNLSIIVTPEPASLSLLVLGGLAIIRRKWQASGKTAIGAE